MDTEQPRTRHQDELLTVRTGVTVAGVATLGGKKTNAIQLVVTTNHHENVHFIQFITRQCPDLLQYADLGLPVPESRHWDTLPAPLYMADLVHPRWHVDVVIGEARTCYYEETGAHAQSDTSLEMIDEPSGAFLPQEDRAVAVVYVISDNKVSREVKWSFQCRSNGRWYYEVQVDANCRKLPNWAVATITKDLFNANNNPDLRGSYVRLTYPCPTCVSPEQQQAVEAIARMKPEDLKEQACAALLSPPEDWYARQHTAFFTPEVSGLPSPTRDTPGATV